MRLDLPHPLAGSVPQVRAPLRLSGSPLSYAAAPPLLGQHTRDVLRDRLGIGDAAFDDLAARGVIGALRRTTRLSTGVAFRRRGNGMTGVTRTRAFWITYAIASLAGLFIAVGCFRWRSRSSTSTSRCRAMKPLRGAHAGDAFASRPGRRAGRRAIRARRHDAELRRARRRRQAGLRSAHPRRSVCALLVGGAIVHARRDRRGDRTAEARRHRGRIRAPAARGLRPRSGAQGARSRRARALAEARARDDWGIALTAYRLLEQSQQTQISGRVDHSFTYGAPSRS